MHKPCFSVYILSGPLYSSLDLYIYIYFTITVIVQASAQHLGTYSRTKGRINTKLDLAPLLNDSHNSISNRSTHSGTI
jgi:hypothetical protein